MRRHRVLALILITVLILGLPSCPNPNLPEDDGGDDGTTDPSADALTINGDLVFSGSSPVQADSGFFGISLAGHGDWSIVGAHGESFDDGGGPVQSGQAHIYNYSGGNWSYHSAIQSSDAADGDSFGTSLAASADWMIVGAPCEDGGTGDTFADSGAVYAYSLSGGVWTEDSIIHPSAPQSSAHFGQTLSISGDYLIAGSPWYAEGALDYSGRAYIFYYNGSSWEESAVLEKGTPAFGDQFGSAVSIDGVYAFVAAINDDVGGADSGAVYVYHLSAGIWSYDQQLSFPASVTTLEFGTDVDLQGDTAVVSYTNTADSGQYVTIYTNETGTWTEGTTLTPSEDYSISNYGYNLALHSPYVAVSARLWDQTVPVAVNNAGRIILFKLNDSVWGEDSTLLPAAVIAEDKFGTALAVSDRGLFATAVNDEESSAAPYLAWGTLYVYK